MRIILLIITTLVFGLAGINSANAFRLYNETKDKKVNFSIEKHGSWKDIKPGKSKNSNGKGGRIQVWFKGEGGTVYLIPSDYSSGKPALSVGDHDYGKFTKIKEGSLTQYCVKFYKPNHRSYKQYCR